MSGYAYPRPLPKIDLPPDEAVQCIHEHAGMTLRDYFAAKALQGILAHPDSAKCASREVAEAFAYEAYLAADAMLIAGAA